MTYKLTVAAVVLLAALIAIPGMGLVTYMYGGQYYHEAYPLVQGHEWVIRAAGSAENAPVYTDPQALVTVVHQQMSLGWAYLNQSDKATGVGNGSPCWYFANPSQTYGYPNELLREADAYLHNLSSEPALFNDSMFQATFGIIASLLHGAASSMTGEGGPGIEGCVYIGEWTWFVWLFGYIGFGGAGVVGLFVAAIIVNRREARGKYSQWVENVMASKQIYTWIQSESRPGHSYTKVDPGGNGYLYVFDDGQWEYR